VSETQEVTPLQRKALGSLGRNVLHFHRLETQLKRLLLLCDLGAPLSQFVDHHKERAEEIRITTMGNLVNALHERLYGTTVASETQAAITEIYFRVQFQIDADPAYVAQQKQNLSNLVLERNNLIHHDLASFDPNSSESCERLIGHLDAQNERILVQHRTLQQLLDTHSQIAAELLRFMETDEFKREFQLPPPAA
jgi:hypothetical protein